MFTEGDLIAIIETSGSSDINTGYMIIKYMIVSRDGRYSFV